MRHPKSRIIAVCLALAFGGVGGHYFYLGQKKEGFLYLIFCWTLIPALLSIKDILVMVTMGEKEWNLTYNSPVRGRIHYF